ncbi:uridine diphosphate-N-acetylglucosamine-binding protein YvcK [Motilimonas sp. 1_MG-2023]|uniref:uridine diphosphate-N-acetylglucosamine-binding protein YvcK n=1 Tax=Motilimonas sp. 1_MG-2023 TaxID=3062672 RepID=UPI0026E3BE48|nr:uridine diphosphate-N-acetylglucosamine-binding protein YvcK [Motilimonas sp. 1_MG-2023]MDO6526526.1 uridine diphosphate-N-acetylglucosamine-binding protein YvcK [Motilimonas sp. 1_MG-2023]
MPEHSLQQFSQVVAIGGGHGLGRLLSSLSYLGPKLTGIVTTTDNGGSTGRIRQSEDCIAWGDLRNCINQLVPEPSIGSMLFEYRFPGKGEFSGHNLGNLMLLALDQLSIRPVDAIKLISNMLKVSSQILPMAEQPADLMAMCSQGKNYHGEVLVDQMQSFPSQLAISPNVCATPEAIAAIEQAELILLGPGSFLTSIMPPLLLPDLQTALRKSQAKVIFIANLVPELSPADQLSLNQQLNWCEAQMDMQFIDYVILPYGSEPLTDYQMFYADLAETEIVHRHDRDKLSKAIENVVSLFSCNSLNSGKPL